MRFYRIIITDPASGNVIIPKGFDGLLGGATYTSFVNNQNLPGAWNVELDVPVIGAATPQGFAFVRVWGISLAEISQANDLAGKNIQVFAGMQKGLPLANPKQSGLILQGVIFQAFGNWIETDMTLDLVVMPGSGADAASQGVGTIAAPKNIVMNWTAGQTLSAALGTCLSTAFPGYKQQININSSIVRPSDEVGFFPSLEQLAVYVRDVSLSVVKTKGYPGVTLLLAPGNVLTAFDGSAGAGTPKTIAFQDLIGQPTWIDAPNIQFKTVMRADIAVGDQITMPPTVTTNTQQAVSSLVNQRASFQGTFFVVSARHVGNFRQPSGDSWVTVFEAAPNTLAA